MDGKQYLDLANTWRKDAEVLRRYGQETLAALLERLAADVEATGSVSSTERVSLDDAVHITGYCKGHLRRLVRLRKLPNVGTARNPAFLLADLPRKPGHIACNKNIAHQDHNALNCRYKQVARAVVQGG